MSAGEDRGTSARVVVVVAAVIVRDGKVLAGQRRPDSQHPYKWEFPGGKVEPGETPEQALRRELREELEIEAEIDGEMTRYRFQYPGRPPIELVFQRVTKYRGELVNRAFHAIRWERMADLAALDFLEGDVDFVRRLARGEFSEA